MVASPDAAMLPDADKLNTLVAVTTVGVGMLTDEPTTEAVIDTPAAGTATPADPVEVTTLAATVAPAVNVGAGMSAARPTTETDTLASIGVATVTAGTLAVARVELGLVVAEPLTLGAGVLTDTDTTVGETLALTAAGV